MQFSISVIFQTGSKNPASHSIYQKTNSDFGKLAKRLNWILIKFMAPFFTLFPIFTSIYMYISSDFNMESFKQIYPAS